MWLEGRLLLNIKKNDELASSLLREMYREYSEDRAGMHPSVSDLIYCLTKSYYNSLEVGKLEPPDKTKLYFLIGLGLEASLLTARKLKQTYGTYEGIHYHVDSQDQGLLELKSTRMSPKTIEEKGPSAGWIKQAKSYCKATGVTSFDLAIVHLIQPQFDVYRVSFEQRELDSHWEWMLERKQVWDRAKEVGEAPAAFQHNEEWECKECPYLLVCQTKNRMGI